MRTVLAGPDGHGLAAALERAGATVSRAEVPLSRDRLADAGTGEADVVVLTDMSEASAIPVAKELNPGVRVVTYADATLPEYAKGQADLALDPALLDADVVAEELVGDG